VSESFKVGDLVSFQEPARPWTLVYVDVERGFARVEFAGEGWVRSRVVELSDLKCYREAENVQSEV